MNERVLDGRVAIVTGAGRGLGRAMAEALACPTDITDAAAVDRLVDSALPLNAEMRADPELTGRPAPRTGAQST